MKANATDPIHVENGPIGRTLLYFAVPVLLTQLLQELYSAADCAVVGHFCGNFALAAAGSSALLLSTMINFFVGFSSGISVITGQLFGAFRYADLKKVITAVFRFALLSGLAMTLILYLCAGPILRLLNCPAEVMPDALAYLGIILPGLSAQLISNIGIAILRSVGDTRTPLILFLYSSLSNLILDLFFVVILSMGIRGAALATLLAQLFLAVLITRRLRRADPAWALRFTGPALSTTGLLKLLQKGVPAGMQALFMSISSLLVQISINSFGADAVAGMTVYARIEGCLYLPSFAYGIALTAFISQNAGAGRYDRIRDSVQLSLRIMCLIMIPLSIVLMWTAPYSLRLFTNQQGILDNALEAALLTFPVYIIYAINQVYLGAIKGLGDTAWPMVCTLLCYSLFRVIWCHLLIPFFPTMRVVYLSYDISFFLMLFLLLPRYRKMLRQHLVQPEPAAAV